MFITKYIDDDDKASIIAMLRMIVLGGGSIFVKSLNIKDDDERKELAKELEHTLEAKENMTSEGLTTYDYIDETTFINALEEIAKFTVETLEQEITFENLIIPAVRKTLKAKNLSFTPKEKKVIFFDLARFVQKEEACQDNLDTIVDYIAKEFGIDSDTREELFTLARKFDSIYNQCEEIINE